MQALKMLAAAVLALVAGLGPAAAQAPAFPNREVRFVVPFAPGGPTDILTRAISDRLQVALGVPVVVENRAGGGGVVGALAAARARPDGHTLYLGGISTMAVAPALSSDLPFDPVRSFDPVTLATRQSVMLMVNPRTGIDSLQAYIEAARTRPEGLSFATSGNATSGHMAGAAFQLATGARLLHVPYRGSAPALIDLTAGQVDSMFGTMLAAVPFVRNGQIRALAVSGASRSPALPDVPTFAELGLTDFDPSAWNGVFVPAGTPRPVIDRLNAEIVNALNSPDLRERLVSDGSIPSPSTPEELTRFLLAEQAKWRDVVRRGGVTPER